jgi:hypothetical protein
MSPHRRFADLIALVLVAAASTALAASAAVTTSPGVPALVVDGGTAMTLSGSTRLTTAIDLRNYCAFSPSNGSTVTLVGYGAPALLGIPSFSNLTLALSGTASLANASSVSGTLTLASGRLSLAGHDLEVNALAGGSAASYVMTPDTLGRLLRFVSSTTPTNFPVGNSSYDPVSVRTGTGADMFRIAVLDAPPAANLTPAASLTRAWAVSAYAPGTDGAITYAVQWNGTEAGASFDRSFGNPTSALAWRYLDGAWAPQLGVRTTDNATYPAVDNLVTTNSGLWTLASPGSLLAVDPPGLMGTPRMLELAQNTPNPVVRTTSIRYGLPVRAAVSLALYSVLGERVVTLPQGVQAPGYHVATLDAGRLAGGMYFYRLEAGGAAQTRKVIVIK